MGSMASQTWSWKIALLCFCATASIASLLSGILVGKSGDANKEENLDRNPSLRPLYIADWIDLSAGEEESRTQGYQTLPKPIYIRENIEPTALIPDATTTKPMKSTQVASGTMESESRLANN